MQITTTQCGKFRHPEFVLECDERLIPRENLQRIADTIESMVASGSTIKADQTFQIGWVFTLVKPYDSARLTLVEPDMRQMPVHWVPGVTQTLRQMMVQLFMLDSVDLRDSMTIGNFGQSLVACTRYTEADFVMDRVEEDDHASGWFLGCADESHEHNDPDNLHLVSLYEAFVNEPAIEGFLTFPPGSTITVSRRHGVHVAYQGNSLLTSPDSFLAQWSLQYQSR